MTQPADREVLKELAKQVKSGVILEIGSKHGNSARAMALFAKVPVYAIDMWDLTFLGDDRPKIHLHDDKLFRRMTAGMNVIPVKGLSAEIAKVWSFPIGLLFIDGDHRYDGCMADYNGFAKHIIPGGYLIFHDYEPGFPDVVRAVNEIRQLEYWVDWRTGGFSIIWARRR
jgi:cephalosporin hydroxylase